MDFDNRDYSDFYEDDRISCTGAEILRARLEDIIDRIYSNDDRFPIDNDEIDASIRKMADILDVVVPSHTVSIKFKIWGGESVEKIINENLYNIKKIYSGWSQSATLSFLSEMIINKNFDLLTVGDIADFCYSDYFIKKCEEYGNVL